MTNPDLEENLRKLASLDRGQADMSWLLYLAAEGEERELAKDPIDVLVYQQVGKD